MTNTSLKSWITATKVKIIMEQKPKKKNISRNTSDNQLRYRSTKPGNLSVCHETLSYFCSFLFLVQDSLIDDHLQRKSDFGQQICNHFGKFTPGAAMTAIVEEIQMQQSLTIQTWLGQCHQLWHQVQLCTHIYSFWFGILIVPFVPAKLSNNNSL